eukprot:3882253-Rhodomonas_salina.1
MTCVDPNACNCMDTQFGAVPEWIHRELLAEDAPDLADDYQRSRDLDLEPGPRAYFKLRVTNPEPTMVGGNSSSCEVPALYVEVDPVLGIPCNTQYYVIEYKRGQVLRPVLVLPSRILDPRLLHSPSEVTPPSLKGTSFSRLTSSVPQAGDSHRANADIMSRRCLRAFVCPRLQS